MYWDVYRGGFDRMRAWLGRDPADADLFDMGIMRPTEGVIKIQDIPYSEFLNNKQFIIDHRPTLFIENPDLVKIIRGAKYSVKLTDLRLPFSKECLSISFPSICHIPPILISLPNMTSVCESMLKADKIGDGLFSHCPPGFEHFFRSKYADKCIGVDKPETAHITISTWGSCNDVFCAKCFEDAFEEVMQQELEEEYIGQFGSINGFQRLAIGVLIYCQAFHDSIIPGFPASMKDRNKKHAMGAGSFTLGLDAQFKTPHGTHLSPRAHWRQGHFRSLRDEKFRRNPDGSVRIVYVHDCIVSGGVDPYTLPGENV